MEATSNKPQQELPAIPNKRYFNIGEVSFLCAVKPHVLRYWEQEFSKLRPSKRKGNRRYYQIKDVEMARLIRELLYKKGFTIQGARQYLANMKAGDASETHNTALANTQAAATIKELEDILDILK